MRLNLKSVLDVPGASLPFSFSLDLSGLDFYGERPFSRPVQVSGEARNRAGALVLGGTAETVLTVTCARCGVSMEKPLCAVLDTLLAEWLEQEASDEIVLLDGEELDLGELSETAVILAMDSKNLCKEDCKGLCPGCGVNLNEEPCRCKRETDPRLAALAQLLE